MRRATAVPATVLLVVLGACGSKSDHTSVATPPTTATPHMTIETTTTTTAAATSTAPKTVATSATSRSAVASSTTARQQTTTTAARPATQTTTAPAPSGGAAITISNFQFVPPVLNVGTGTKVTATNQDDAAHTWTADDGSWTSGNLARGQAFARVFGVPGDYPYHCEIHSSMRGTVHVS